MSDQRRKGSAKILREMLRERERRVRALEAKLVRCQDGNWVTAEKLSVELRGERTRAEKAEVEVDRLKDKVQWLEAKVKGLKAELEAVE